MQDAAEASANYEVDGIAGILTGRLYVRVAAGIQATDIARSLAEHGLVIDTVPSYAAHTAWVKHPTKPWAALTELAGVAEIDSVAAVEPEVRFSRQAR